jgi:hypothetical protein
MNPRSRRSFQCFTWQQSMLLLILSSGLIGCGGNAHAVKPDVAQQTLRSALDSWKSGQTVESLKKGSPSIVVQDLDWSGGAKLLDYEVLDGGKPVDANLQAKVKLKLRDAKDVESEKTVSYLVGTSPVLTVFRDMFH